MAASAELRIQDLPGPDRELAIPVLKEGFVGIYRWHAKRKLLGSDLVRAAWAGRELVGFAILEQLLPQVGYVYYVAVGVSHRRAGVGRRLLDDALARFQAGGTEVVYAAAEEDNEPSIALFHTRGFREVSRDEPGWAEGGLGAWGLRSRMMVVHGEVLLGLRLRPPAAPSTQ